MAQWRSVGALAVASAVGLPAPAGCATEQPPTAAKHGDPAVPEDPRATPHRGDREAMVRDQIAARGITDARVLEAMRTTPRHAFVPERWRTHAHDDRPLPIGHAVTISQPYIVALMSELARVEPGDRVLEIGTGSGYQTAVLAELGARVYSIEIIEALATEATQRLASLGYRDVRVRHGDGYRGWPEHAPFDAILIAAAPPAIPEPLTQQLAVGGRLVLPVGTRSQELMVITRTGDGLRSEAVIPVRFVPMIGEALDGQDRQ